MRDLMNGHETAGKVHANSEREISEIYGHDLIRKKSMTGSPLAVDVFAQLAQKEHDLVLAAELGKALLEKNQELQRSHDQTTEELAQKVEEWHQEKHQLRQRMEVLESEYQSTVTELERDLGEAKGRLEREQKTAREGIRARSTALSTLTQQNQRLSDQLKQSMEAEEQLQGQVQMLREQMIKRRGSATEHVSQLELLRQEIALTTGRRGELERRVQTLIVERDSYASSLEEAQEQLLLFEQEKRQRKGQEQQSSQIIGQLEKQNHQLSHQLEHRKSSSPCSCSSSSLHAELSEFADLAGDLDLRPASPSLHQADGGELGSDSLALNLANELTRNRIRLRDVKLALERKDQQLQIVRDQIKTMEEEMEERQRVQDGLEDAELGDTRDAVVETARNERDRARRKEREAQGELMSCRLDFTSLNSQLLEAIQQKVALAEQLEQWQLDMENVLSIQMKQKIIQEEQASSDSACSSPATSKRRLVLPWSSGNSS